MKKQVILGLATMMVLLVLVSSAQAANITIVKPGADDEISGSAYVLNATSIVNSSTMTFSWSTDNATRNIIGTNSSGSSLGKIFTLVWNTSGLCTGNYTLNATSNWSTTDVAYANFSINNNVLTLVAPTDGITIGDGNYSNANYTFNATTNVSRNYVNFSYSSDDGATWTIFASNNTPGKVFTVVWNTTNLADGTYDFNASTNCTIEGERTEIAIAEDVIIDNVPTVDSPEFTPIVMAALIGLLSVSAILLRKKK